MTHFYSKAFCATIISLTIVNALDPDVQQSMNFQHPRFHLRDKKFDYGEYSEYPGNNENERRPESGWNRTPQRNIQSPKINNAETKRPSKLSDTSDPIWDPSWLSDDKYMGQLSAVDVDPEGRIAILSRGKRIWGLTTFDNANRFDYRKGPIKENTIILYDRTGRKLLQWGKNMFYLPHGLTIDNDGNYWLTDLALHQVFKFDANDIKNSWNLLKSVENETDFTLDNIEDYQSRFNHSIIRPSMILGEAFQPGQDIRKFCKPTSVAVAQNGDFFVSDGYCNSRIIKFNKNGEIILHWGRSWTLLDNVNKSPPSYALFVPHSLALAEDQNLIYVADREDGRVMSYNAQNGTFYREYKHREIGPKIYAVAYARQHIYLVNGPEVFTSRTFHVKGFVIDTNTGSVVSQFGPGSNDMKNPHDIALSKDGSEIYVVELDAHKVYRFIQDTTKISSKKNSTFSENATLFTRLHHGPLTDDTSSSSEHNDSGHLVLSIIISAMILIGLCLAVAAVVARCQKRGCLLSVRKRAYWEAERRENFKLSSLLDTRQGKNFKILEKRPNTRDFNKLSTEPESSEDEQVRDSLVI